MSLDYDTISANAKDGSPFSNGTSGEIWMGSWCYRCKVDAAFQAGTSEQGCPILLVALVQQTPAEWTETGLQDYTCSEFRPIDGPDDGFVWPLPEPLPGQTDMFEVFADDIAVKASEVAHVNA